MDVISMKDLVLPAMHICGPGGEVRVVRSMEMLALVRGYCMPPDNVPNYYWASNNHWYKTVHIHKVGKVPFFRRLAVPSDLVVASFDLEPIDQPISDLKLFHEMSLCAVATTDKAKYKEARKALKTCKTAPEVIAWFDREANVIAHY